MATAEAWPTGNDRPFGTCPAIDGSYLVIAQDTGREVAVRESLLSASGVAWKLNQAAQAGPSALAKTISNLR